MGKEPRKYYRSTSSARKLIGLKLTDPKSFNISSYCQKPWFIPESTKLDIQLMEFKKEKNIFL